MSDIPPPEVPGWYADAQGAWWWWDGSTWSPAPGSGGAAAQASQREQERIHALLMWFLYLAVGGWIAALFFYLVSRERPFVRHHAAEALNLTLVLLVPQIVGFSLLVPDYVGFVGRSFDDPDAAFTFSGVFWVGVAVLVVHALVTYALGIAGAVQAFRGRWWRLPIGLHPVRGVLAAGEPPPDPVRRG